MMAEKNIGSVKLDRILTEDKIEALDKTLQLLSKLNELGILDTVTDILEPEVIERAASLIINPSTLRIVDRIDQLTGTLGKIDYDTLEKRINLLNEALKSIPEKPKRIGLLGLLGELRDPDVQRGMGVLIELLKAIGKAAEKQQK
nr:DUF1641 domain-containing protein [Candidatus Bathyarchaeota archaeon]